MNEPRLQIRNICKTLEGVRILNDISLSVMPGRVTCLLGPSGCGKTTTLRIISGIDRQDSGQVLIDGQIISGDGKHLQPEQRSVGLLFQDFALFPHLTVRDNVAFGLIGRIGDRDARIEELLAKIDLVEFSNRYPHELSGGQQQRVALARALAPRPRIMLMDEPFSNLDDRLRDQVREETFSILKDEDTASLLITHEPEEAMRMADEIVLMRQGSVVQLGSPYQVYGNPVDREAASFFSDINIVHGVVEKSELKTTFGSFAADRFVDGADVEVVIRPQHVKIDFDRQGNGPLPTESDGVPVAGIVTRSRYMGSNSMVEFRLVSDNSLMKVLVPQVFLPPVGSRLWLSLPKKRCMLFPCITQQRVDNPFRKETVSADQG